jgi:hypothetical protein
LNGELSAPGGSRKKLLDDSLGGLRHGRNQRRGHHRATGQRSWRQTGIADHHGNLVERDPGQIGDHLGQDGVGARADILRRRRYASGPIAMQFDDHIRGLSPRRPRSRCDTPTDHQAVATHRTDRRGAILPAELVSAECQAFLEMSRRERHVPAFVHGGLVDQPQLERIDV